MLRVPCCSCFSFLARLLHYKPVSFLSSSPYLSLLSRSFDRIVCDGILSVYSKFKIKNYAFCKTNGYIKLHYIEMETDKVLK